MRRHECEDVFGVQLAGAIPGMMIQCAELVSNEVDCDFIDLNVGCPIDLVFRTVRTYGHCARRACVLSHVVVVAAASLA